ncbi:MAG: hypothetical protein LBG45_02710 [Dysgonamonadaceae bacterium]|nr:hypothetical protein [Dysgonamonadaceae bacterium]
MKRIFLFFCVCFIGFSCNMEKPEGVIVDKQHEPSFMILEYNLVLKQTMPRFYPDRYSVSVRDTAGIVRGVSVNKTAFDTLTVGQYYEH